MVRRALIAALLLLAAPLGGTASGQINLKKIKDAVKKAVPADSTSQALHRYRSRQRETPHPDGDGAGA